MDKAPKVRSVLVVNSTTNATSSGRLMEALAEAARVHLGAKATVTHLDAMAYRGWRKLAVLVPTWRRLRAVWDADVVVVQTMATLAMQEILAARLLGKRVVAIYWDSYPESLVPNGMAVPGRLRPFGWLERALLRRAHRIAPPGDDYLPHLARLGLGRRAKVHPMWPFTPTLPADEPMAESSVLHIGFAGAINPIRGIDGAIREILARSSGPVCLHVYGTTPPALPEDLERAVSDGVLQVNYHGFVEQEALLGRLAGHDLGLVSLAKDFTLPAFPSKAVSYLSAGLPILYFGPKQTGLETFLDEAGIGLTLNDQLEDLHAAARALRGGYGAAQQATLAKIELNGARIADLLQ